MKQLYLSAATLLLAVCPLFGQSKPTAYINARIITVTGDFSMNCLNNQSSIGPLITTS